MSGKSAADWSSPTRGAPSPSKGFHHATCPCHSSEAACAPSAYWVAYTPGVVVGSELSAPPAVRSPA